MRIIAGLDTASAGRVRIGGRDVAGLTPAERNVAMVFQNCALCSSAIAVVFFVLCLAVTLLTFRILERRVHYR